MRKLLIILSLIASTCLKIGAAPGAVPAVTGDKAPQPLARYFEANRGQWPAEEDFRAFGYGFANASQPKNAQSAAAQAAGKGEGAI